MRLRGWDRVRIPEISVEYFCVDNYFTCNGGKVRKHNSTIVIEKVMPHIKR